MRGLGVYDDDTSLLNLIRESLPYVPTERAVKPLPASSFNQPPVASILLTYLMLLERVSYHLFDVWLGFFFYQNSVVTREHSDQSGWSEVS